MRAALVGYECIRARQHDVNTISTNGQVAGGIAEIRRTSARDIAVDGHGDERLGSVLGNCHGLNCRGGIGCVRRELKLC